VGRGGPSSKRLLGGHRPILCGERTGFMGRARGGGGQGEHWGKKVDCQCVVCI